MALDSTVRLSGPPPEPPSESWQGLLEDDPAPPPGSLTVQIDDDGGVTVGIAPDSGVDGADSSKFDANLADDPRLEGALSKIAEDILEGIEADLKSRTQMLANYTEGIDLLGLQIESEAKTKAQKRNISQVRDSTLLESIVKAQSLARGELLPASGPAKVVTVQGSEQAVDDIARAFEADFNQALTVGMPEYVPDMDRGLFLLFYGGNLFRKGYHDPILGRPAVATIAVEDLIVSEEATSLDTAIRVTHRVPAMSPTEVKRRQLGGVWRDIELVPPMPLDDPAKAKQREVAGTQPMYTRDKDRPHVIYECITDLDLEPYGMREKGQPKGLPVPYAVTIDKDSRQILRIARYWRQGDPHFLRKRRIIHYTMVPGFGFLAYGLVHLQGNQVKALTAVLRLMIDALMFAIFPGGMKLRGVKTETNEINPSPGEWVDVGVPGGVDDLRKAVMALPYKDLSPVAVQLYDFVQKAAARVGAAAELEVGEGRANVPVGTVMAMLEEKTVVMAAVHKRLHAAQAQELAMIRELFVEKPESLAKVLPKPTRQWQAASEFADLDLVPASDPNVPSNTHRIMLATALATLAQMPAFAGRMDLDDVLKRILGAIGIGDVDSLIAPPPEGPVQDPGIQAAQASLAAKQMDIEAKREDSRRKAATELAKTQQQDRKSALDMQSDAAKRASEERIAQLHENTERMRLAAEQMREQRQDAIEERKAQQQHAIDLHLAEQERQDRQADRAHQAGMQQAQQAQQAQQMQQAQQLEGRQGPRNFGGEQL